MRSFITRWVAEADLLPDTGDNFAGNQSPEGIG